MGNRVVAPPAFRVDLRREHGHRGVHAPHGAGLADKLVAVLERRTGDRGFRGMGASGGQAHINKGQEAYQHNHQYDRPDRVQGLEPSPQSAAHGYSPRQKASVTAPTTTARYTSAAANTPA